MFFILEFNFVFLVLIFFLSCVFFCCSFVIVLLLMFNGLWGEFGVGDEVLIDDLLDVGFNFGEWFSLVLNEYILD